MRVPHSESVRLVVVAVALAALVGSSVAQGATFDTSSVVAATVVSNTNVDGGINGPPKIAKADVTLSCVNEQHGSALADRWIVKMRPRMATSSKRTFASLGRIVDYAPRTQTASDIDGHVAVKQTAEQSKSSGISFDASYATAIGHVGGDAGSKQSETTEYRRLPELRAIVASGTIDRSTGVVYKLTASPHSILEGEKTFSISFEVPQDWRGNLIDIDVTTIQTVSGKYPWDASSDEVKNYHFTVAVYRSGDVTARRDAERVAAAESRLWDHAAQAPERSHRGHGLMQTLVSTFSGKPHPSQVRASYGANHDRSAPSDHWVSRVIRGTADPHLDRQIVRRSVAERVLALDYVDALDQLVHGDPTTGDGSVASDGSAAGSEDRVVAAKVPASDHLN